MVPNKASAYGASLTRRLDVCVAGMPETESGDLFVEGVPKVNPPFQGALVHRGDFPVLCQCPCKSPACNKKCRRKKGEEQRRLDNAVCVCVPWRCAYATMQDLTMWLQLVIINSQFVDSEEQDACLRNVDSADADYPVQLTGWRFKSRPQDVIQIDLLKDLERVIYSGGSASMWLCAALRDLRKPCSLQTHTLTPRHEHVS